jgi:hypothetical protein
MPDLVLDYHRLKTPIDHLDQSVTRTKLEYPTVNVNFALLAIIDKVQHGALQPGQGDAVLWNVSVTDKAVEVAGTGEVEVVTRWNSVGNLYIAIIRSGETTADFESFKCVNGAWTRIAYEAVDLNGDTGYLIKLSSSGSTHKGFRDDMTTPKFTVTDTSFASGLFGIARSHYGGLGFINELTGYLRAPASTIPPAYCIIEAELYGSGKFDDPYKPLMSENYVEVSSLASLPDFLYRETKKYEILMNKGFTEDEIKFLLGYIPQHQVDLDSVTWGAFEFYPDKAPTVIITIVGDNPYKANAIERQKAKAKRVFTPPKSYDEAVALYNQLKSDYPHWLAGKDNFAYQTLGLEIFDLMQNIDFYHGELLDHMTHYNQLKQVPDWEITNRLSELIDKLSRETVLTDERDKHIAKAREVLKKGW